MIKKIFKIIGMHCSSCGFMIEAELEDIGVKSKASYQKQMVEVEYDPVKISKRDIEKAVRKAGYEIEVS
jgi:P-type Cu+ transporter